MDFSKIPEYKFLSKIDYEENKQIYSKTLITPYIRKIFFFQYVDEVFYPFNKPAKEYIKKQGLESTKSGFKNILFLS